jgi:hypothetical protein
MARNLLKSGQFAKVYVWNRTLSKVITVADMVLKLTPVGNTRYLGPTQRDYNPTNIQPGRAVR